jgi:molecular chaperone GrpE
VEEENITESKADEVEDNNSLREALEEERAKAERYLNNWQRAEADFNNYKKRTEQERSDTIRFANMALVLNLLPVVDDFERAFNTLPAKLAQLTWVNGIQLILRKLQATLEAQGISAIKTIGEMFDPAVHEAVSQGDGEEGKIIEELQKGYKQGERLIRPALVVVGSGKKEEK